MPVWAWILVYAGGGLVSFYLLFFVVAFIISVRTIRKIKREIERDGR